MNQHEKAEAIVLLDNMQTGIDTLLYCLKEQKSHSTNELMSLEQNLEALKRNAPGIAQCANSLCSLIKSISKA